MYFIIVKLQFADFMFPEGTRQEHMKVEGDSNVKAFCKDYVEKVEIMFIFATVASVLVILSLVSKYVSHHLKNPLLKFIHILITTIARRNISSKNVSCSLFMSETVRLMSGHLFRQIMNLTFSAVVKANLIIPLITSRLCRQWK